MLRSPPVALGHSLPSSLWTFTITGTVMERPRMHHGAIHTLRNLFELSSSVVFDGPHVALLSYGMGMRLADNILTTRSKRLHQSLSISSSNVNT